MFLSSRNLLCIAGIIWIRGPEVYTEGGIIRGRSGLVNVFRFYIDIIVKYFVLVHFAILIEHTKGSLTDVAQTETT